MWGEKCCCCLATNLEVGMPYQGSRELNSNRMMSRRARESREGPTTPCPDCAAVWRRKVRWSIARGVGTSKRLLFRCIAVTLFRTTSPSNPSILVCGCSLLSVVNNPLAWLLFESTIIRKRCLVRQHPAFPFLPSLLPCIQFFCHMIPIYGLTSSCSV